MAATTSRSRRIVLTVVLLVIICIALTCGLLVHYLVMPSQNKSPDTTSTVMQCENSCVFTLVESIPEGLVYNETVHQATGPAILQLLKSAEQTIHVASYYWTLQFNDTDPTDPSAQEGQDVFDALHDISREGKVEVKIVQNKPTDNMPDVDTQILARTGGNVEVRSMNFPRLIGAGILHTKMWMVDRRHFYVGSANVDWRSFTQVKEMGVLVQNCSCLADDMDKIFQVYWDLARDDVTVPTSWRGSLSTEFNMATPMSLAEKTADDNKGSVYLASSPSALCPNGRTTDIEAILNIITTAKKFINIAVMDYIPAIIYSKPNRYWPVIDNALKTAAYGSDVSVRLMVSRWQHSRKDMFVFLQSLKDMGRTVYRHINMDVRIFEVPADAAQARLPFARVNHNKYMVTDQHAYIGTSNWSGDYFVATAGIGFIMKQPDTGNSSSSSLRQQLVDVFERDWNSAYVHPLSDYVP